MDDDTKKTPRGGARRGPGERPQGSPEKKGFSGAQTRGAKKPFRKREEGDRKPYAAGDGAKKPFRKREEGDRKPFGKPEREKKPFHKHEEGARPAFRPGKREREEGVAAAPEANVERIARRLARAGVASRRDAEAMIADGRVTLNGKVLDTPAINVSAGDQIEIDGKPIPAVERTRLFLFHKPAGVVTTNRDPEGRRTVFDIMPKGLPRLMTVGRLDINTEGLLLLTNDGGLSRVLELPATGWLRRYRVRVHGKVEPQALEGLKDGIAVDGVFYGGVEATLDREQGSNAWLTIGLREGKNREVKNILGALGLDVTRLIRLSYGPFQLGELAEGEVRELKGKLLRDQLGERLIEESGANFDAPIVTEFSNKPVSAKEQTRREEPAERPNRKREREQKREDALDRLQTKPQRGDKPRPFGDKDKPKSFGDRGKPKPYGDRDKPKSFGDRDKPKPYGDKDKQKRFGGKPGKPGEREERAPEKQRSRSANVWMAPGARPVGEKKAAALAERNEGRRYAGKPRPAGKDGSRPASAPKGPRKPRGDR